MRQGGQQKFTLDVDTPPPVVQSPMKRSTSEGMGFFSRLRRTTNCWTMPRSQTSQRVNDKVDNHRGDRSGVAGPPKFDIAHSDSSDDDDFPPRELRAGFSEPDVRKSGKTDREPEFQSGQVAVKEKSDLPDGTDVEKLSLAEALSGLRNATPPSLHSIKVVQCRVNNEQVCFPTEEEQHQDQVGTASSPQDATAVCHDDVSSDSDYGPDVEPEDLVRNCDGTSPAYGGRRPSFESTDAHEELTETS